MLSWQWGWFMNINLYKYAGMAAITLAVLFPLYWLYAITEFSMDALREDFLTLSAWDILFIVIGALEVFVYIALSRIFRDQMTGTLPSILLIIMAVLVAAFHSTVVVDMFLALGFGGDYADTIVTIAVVFSLICLFLYTLAAFIFSIVLLVRFSSLSVLMRFFAIGLLIACLVQFSIVFAALNTLLFPLLMLIVSIYFLRGGETVDVV